MASSLLETGPKMDWTRDNKIYDRYCMWKTKVELIFSSVLVDAIPSKKSSYLRLWMGDEGIPPIRKWESTVRISFQYPEAVPATNGRREIPISNGFLLKTFWDVLDAELKPKGNKIFSVIELWTQSKQGSKRLNEWLTYIYNLVELSDYGDSKDRIIRDVLIIGCNSEKAKDKIACKGGKVTLNEVIEILQTEVSTQKTLIEMNSDMKKVYYAFYDKKKSKGIKMPPLANSKPSTASSTSTMQNSSSTRVCYCCRKPHPKEHETICKGKNSKCLDCGEIGHFKNCYKKLGNFPQKPNSTNKIHIISSNSTEQNFFDEEGNPVTISNQHMFSVQHSKKELLIKFGVGKNYNSIS